MVLAAPVEVCDEARGVLPGEGLKLALQLRAGRAGDGEVASEVGKRMERGGGGGVYSINREGERKGVGRGGGLTANTYDSEGSTANLDGVSLYGFHACVAFVYDVLYDKSKYSGWQLFQRVVLYCTKLLRAREAGTGRCYVRPRII